MRKLLVLVVAGLIVGAATAPSANAERAFVTKNGAVFCLTDPGDVPGTGAFLLPKATLVQLADGTLILQCHGTLPAGVSFPTARVFSAPCNGVPNAARIVVTTSGRVNAVCRVPGF